MFCATAADWDSCAANADPAPLPAAALPGAALLPQQDTEMLLRPICFQLGEGCCRKKRSPTTASSAAPGSHWSGPMLCQSCDSVSECGLCMSLQSCTRGNQPS